MSHNQALLCPEELQKRAGRIGCGTDATLKNRTGRIACPTKARMASSLHFVSTASKLFLLLSRKGLTLGC
jgi:hypothetical protein